MSLFKLALANILEHKAKSLILGILIATGVMMLVVGTGFTESVRRGLEKDFRTNYTGDIVIHGQAPEGAAIHLFGVNTSSVNRMPPPIPAITELDKVLETVKKTDGVSQITTCISGIAVLKPDNSGEKLEVNDEKADQMPLFFLLSGDKNSYYKIFNGIKVLEGTLPTGEGAQAMIDSRLVPKYKAYYNMDIAVGSTLLIESFMGDSTLREVTVCGIFEQPRKDTAMMPVVYTDPGTARSFTGLTAGRSYPHSLSAAADVSIAQLDEDSLFSDEVFSAGAALTAQSAASNAAAEQVSSAGQPSKNVPLVRRENFTEESIMNILGSTALRDELNKTDDGAWHFVIVKLENPASADEKILQLNRLFLENDVKAHAINWKAAAVSFVSTADMISGLMTAFSVILAVVVFIVIMNTLFVSVIERTSEIGTMRALGAKRTFIRKMFFIETVLLSFVSSTAGAVLGLILSFIINAMSITLEGETLRVLLGGGAVTVTPVFSSILGIIALLCVFSIAAQLYPVSAALKITPLSAINKGE